MMTRANAGGTKHGWLVDDLAVILADLRRTADSILRNLTLYQETHNENHLTAVALRSAELFQAIARLTTIMTEMRQLIEASKPARQAKEEAEQFEQLFQELAAIGDILNRVSGEARHD